MLNMTVRNLPRGSGKTATIKLAIAEMALKPTPQTTKIILIAHTNQVAEMYRRWAKAYSIDISVYSRQPLFRGINKPLMVFIDEPFLLPASEQESILKELTLISLHQTVEVFALGTLPENLAKPTFKDYL